VNNIEILKLILKMYSFEQPMPDSVKKQMLISMRKNLIIILKRFGKYGLLTMAAVYLLFLLKNVGLSISLFKAYILLLVTSVLMAGAISIVVYSVIKKHITVVLPVRETTLACIKPNDKKLKPQQQSITSVRNYKLEMFPFAVSGRITSESNKVTNTIFSCMKKQLNETVVLSELNQSADSPYMMLGSVIQLENTNTIHARLVDARNSIVLMYVSQEWINDDDLNIVAEKIALAFSQRIEQ
jgi:hypothetical protein